MQSSSLDALAFLDFVLVGLISSLSCWFLLKILFANFWQVQNIFFKHNLTMAAFSSVASQSSLLWSLQACYLKIELWKRILAMRLQTKLNKFQSAGGLVEEQD